MPERSGLGAQIGFATEEEYGKFKAPTRFLPLLSEGLTLTKEYAKSKGLRANRLVMAKNLHRATTRTVDGDVSLEFLDQGMGLLLNVLHGEEVAPAKIGETAAYKQLHEIGLSSPIGKSLTAQVGRPDTGGTVQPFSYLGCKVTEAKLTIETGENASWSLSVDGQDESTDEALAEATYDADALPYVFQEMTVKVGGEAAGNVRSITITIPVPQNTERYHLGNEGTKDEPLANEMQEITAEATLEFASLADHTRYKEEEVVTLELNGKGAAIDEANSMEAKAKFTAAKQVSSEPTVDGPDVLTTDVSFEGLDNGSEAPLSIEVISTDSTL